MPPGAVGDFQTAISACFIRCFAGVPVEKEWCAFGRRSEFYGPRLDLAVGPFALADLRLEDEYRQLSIVHRRFLEMLWDCHQANLREAGITDDGATLDDAIIANPNARCLLAIEIEHRVSRKHLMGGALNAAALGRLGLAVGWTGDKVRALARLRSYLLFLRRVGKPTFDTTNLLILSKEQLWDSLRAAFPHHAAEAR